MAAYRRVYMTHVTCRLTAKNRDQLRNPTLGNRVWATFTFFTLFAVLKQWLLLQRETEASCVYIMMLTAM